MRASVVINTYNRGPSLRQTLRALRHQTCADFEVVVVNGPSTDDTAAVLAEHAGAVRVGHCPEVHLSRSRNIGISLAVGDVIAFIDDDAVPEPAWLADLLAAYDSGQVGGAGGVVYDHTGFRLQYRYATCDRVGTPCFDADPPFDDFTRPGADPFVYLQGTNASFRRTCLAEIGGFDEEIEYFLDESEVCMRVLDRGYLIRPLAGAAVHHKYLASHLRSAKKVILNPYPLVKNRCYFALQNGLSTRPLRDVRRVLDAYADGLRTDCAAHFAARRIDAAQRDFFLAQLDKGLRDGTRRGLEGQRRRREIPSADERRFLPYPVLRPTTSRLTLCLIGQGEAAGGAGPAALAQHLAALGHEVHAVTRSADVNRVDFEEGVWAHRLAAPRRRVAPLEPLAWRQRLYQAAAVYREVDRIHARGALDAVLVPLPAREGLFCPLDARFTTLLLDNPDDREPAPQPGGGLHGAVLRRSETAVRCPLPSSTPAQIERLLAVCQAASRSRGRGGELLRPTAAGQVVTAHVAAVLTEAGVLPCEAAGRAAAALLDPACFPTDYPAAVLGLWSCPEDAFVQGLFLVLLGREVDPPSQERYVRLLCRGMPRGTIVRHLALSREAAENGLPLAWLKNFGRLAPVEPARPGRVRLLDRLRILATRLAWAAKHHLRPAEGLRRRAG